MGTERTMASNALLAQTALLAKTQATVISQRLQDSGEASPTQTNIAFDDPAACSAEDIANAIRMCQVGRNSSSYAVALEETPEETAARRAKELIVENSAEAKKARELIRRTVIGHSLCSSSGNDQKSKTYV